MKQITTVYAYLDLDKDTLEEGIVAIEMANKMFPLIGATIHEQKELKNYVKFISTSEKKNIKLVKFTSREEIEEFKPQGDKNG